MKSPLTRGVILAFGLVLMATVAQAQQYAAVVMDARTGKVIYARNADAIVHPASLTKMMTLYVVFDQVRQGRLSLDQKVTISQNAASEPPSKLGLRAGQQIEVRYLIRAAAIKSANDAATALGEAVAGSEDEFARLMTQYARAMGLRVTTFRNAHGLTATGHMSTALEMTELGRRLHYDFPQYYNIFGRRSTSAGIKTVQNTNRRLLDAYKGADGIKTGYTKAAGFNLVSSAQRGDRRVIVTVMGAKSSGSRNAEVAKLMDLGFSKMPARARVQASAPVSLRVAGGATPPQRAASQATGPSTAAVVASAAPAAAEPRRPSVVLGRSTRPLPRSMKGGTQVAVSSEAIAEAVARVNSDLAARQATRSAPLLAGLMGRPAPRPSASSKDTPASAPSRALAQAASTFGVAAAPPPRERPEEILVSSAAGVEVASSGTTGGDAWGVELGAFRSKGDAERQLLTTALHDVPELAGGLRRVEAASVQGVTVYRAQFVGLSQTAALGACQSIARLNATCETLAPGI